jgi:rubredoxin
METTLNAGIEGVPPGLPGVGLSGSPLHSGPEDGTPPTIPHAWEHYSILFIRSRCHLKKWKWEPEVNSPAWRRALMAEVPKVKPKKFHWEGGSCVWVVGPHSALTKSHHVNGTDFDSLPDEARCVTCNANFQAA